LWASRVASIAGPQFAGDASAAPGVAQVTALRNVFLWAVVVLLVAIAIGIWGLRKERELRAT
jgi:protein-S-isoprenylcysteine O-methyltransferase Ste14